MPEFDPATNLIINYIPPQMTERELSTLFSEIGEVVNCRLMIIPQTRESMGYGFIQYANALHADMAIKQLNGLQIQGKQMKVSFARGSSEETKDTNVYIAGLPATMNDDQLKKLFDPFGEILTHKVIDKKGNTGHGIAFVRYSKKSEADEAISQMAGKELPGSTVPLTVKHAIPPTEKNAQKAQSNLDITATVLTNKPYSPMKQVSQDVQLPPIPVAISQVVAKSGLYITPGSGHSGLIGDQPTSLYVYGLAPETDEVTLYKLFTPFGALLNVRLIYDLTKEPKVCKGYAFVNFRKYEDACCAIVAMNGFVYEGKPLQVSQSKK